VDQNRQIRLLIPPFFLVASVLWRAYLSGQLNDYLRASPNSDAASLKLVVSILGIVGVSTLPVGYAIGALTFAILRLFPLRFVFPHRDFDIPISRDAMKTIWEELAPPILEEKQQARYRLCAATVFDHVLLRKEIHEWLFRRWTSFLVSAQCVTALLLSIWVGDVLQIRPSSAWWKTISGLGVIFLWNAVKAWREAHRMFSFAAELKVTRRSKLEDGRAVEDS
jgi:hypothetical protein